MSSNNLSAKEVVARSTHREPGIMRSSPGPVSLSRQVSLVSAREPNTISTSLRDSTDSGRFVLVQPISNDRRRHRADATCDVNVHAFAASGQRACRCGTKMPRKNPSRAKNVHRRV